MLSPLLALLALPALAADAVSIEVIHAGQQGTSPPALVLIANTGLADLTVHVECGGAVVDHGGGADRGARIQLDLPTQPGAHHCTGTMSVTSDAGAQGEGPLSFDVEMLRPLQLQVQDVDTDTHQLSVQADRPISQVEVTAWGMGGAQVGHGLAPVPDTPADTPVSVQWSGSGEVIRMELRVTDTHGFWSALELFPWHYDIPHEDVVFETAQAIIRPSEEPKLLHAMEQVQGVLDKYGAEAKVNLYVGGYTDTVGDSFSNQRLSEGRAVAISRWFEAHGFTGSIYAQGFGERGLAVATPDEVDEPRNRRAVYILAAQPPPQSPALPATAWKQIR